MPAHKRITVFFLLIFLATNSFSQRRSDEELKLYNPLMQCRVENNLLNFSLSPIVLDEKANAEITIPSLSTDLQQTTIKDSFPQQPDQIKEAANLGTGTGSSTRGADADEALKYHNKARADVGTAPLQWSEELSDYAQEWADHLAADGCRIYHRPGSGKWKQQYGENVYLQSGQQEQPNVLLNASQNWYDEIKKYKYGILDESNWYGTGHYTQMVWRDTKKVGMGIGHCTNGSTIVVANYDPPGNYMGERPY